MFTFAFFAVQTIDSIDRLTFIDTKLIRLFASYIKQPAKPLHNVSKIPKIKNLPFEFTTNIIHLAKARVRCRPQLREHILHLNGA